LRVKRPPSLGSVWRTDQGLSAMLVLLALTLLVGVPLSDTSQGDLVFGILFSLLLVTGVVTVARRRMLTVAVSMVAGATLVLRWASFRSPDSSLRIWSDALAIVSLAVFTTLVLVQVFREGPITTHRIQGSILVYLLIGFTWSVAYQLLYSFSPAAFSFAQGDPGAAHSRDPLVYYSFVTLTTVGYGDITPVHPTARSLATAEALIGQLYPAILIARLVSLRISSSRQS
jgi:hypothetical protein